MNLLFDLTASQPSASIKRHGGGKYCEILFFRMCERGLSFHAFYDSSRYINSKVIEHSQAYDIRLFDIKEKSLHEIVDEEKITTIYSALPEQIKPWPNCKILGTIHGLRSLEMPYDFWGRRLLDNGLIGLNSFLGFLKEKKTKRCLEKYYKDLLHQPNFCFVTVSNHSKSVIQNLCPAKAEVPVFYPPSTSTINSDKKNTEKYLLLVSADRIEKNCTRAIIAIDQMLSTGNISANTLIKITGLKKNVSRYKIRNQNNFKFLGYVEEEELDNLYANAYAFVYPSLNEGFGYPPIEAMKYQVPVIASSAASIPEVCDSAAIYFNPTSIKSIKNALELISQEPIRAEYSRKAKQQFEIITKKQENDCQKLIDWIIQNSL